jgi:hypothetical protein
MPERLERGIWPHPPLRFADVVQTLADYLRNCETFPDLRISPHEDRLIRDGGRIRRLGLDRYLYRAQLSDPLDPGTITQSGEVSFSTAEEAAQHYLSCDLRLPGDLDGWKVID